MKNSKARWILTIFFTSILLSVVFTASSEAIMAGTGYIVAVLILLLFIAIGIVFVIIGVAVTSATEPPFHSMASHREKGAAEAIRLLKNAEKVASICNDVVGDISGIVSGSTSAIVVGMLVQDFSFNKMVLQLLFSGLVAGLTIGGKALGKSFGLRESTRIVLSVGKVVYYFGKIFRKKK